MMLPKEKLHAWDSEIATLDKMLLLDPFINENSTPFLKREILGIIYREAIEEGTESTV